MEPTYTVQEVARMLGLHPYTVQRWCASGHVPGAHFRFGIPALGWRIPQVWVNAVAEGKITVHGTQSVPPRVGSDQ